MDQKPYLREGAPATGRRYRWAGGVWKKGEPCALLVGARRGRRQSVGIVAAVVQKYPKGEIHEGDMFIGNDPYTGGGSHLPDIVITAPVLYKGVLVGFVANVGHHADLFDRGGGENIWQEGLRIPPIRIV